jgi:hypothetical protein
MELPADIQHALHAAGILQAEKCRWQRIERAQARPSFRAEDTRWRVDCGGCDLEVMMWVVVLRGRAVMVGKCVVCEVLYWFDVPPAT